MICNAKKSFLFLVFAHLLFCQSVVLQVAKVELLGQCGFAMTKGSTAPRRVPPLLAPRGAAGTLHPHQALGASPIVRAPHRGKDRKSRKNVSRMNPPRTTTSSFQNDTLRRRSKDEVPREVQKDHQSWQITSNKKSSQLVYGIQLTKVLKSRSHRLSRENEGYREDQSSFRVSGSGSNIETDKVSDIVRSTFRLGSHIFAESSEIRTR